MEPLAPIKSAKIKRWLPYWAVFQADFRQTLHSQQQLMLLCLQPILLRSGLTEVQKLADLPPELGQVAILIGS